jgi:hypothetical protein
LSTVFGGPHRRRAPCHLPPLLRRRRRNCHRSRRRAYRYNIMVTNSNRSGVEVLSAAAVAASAVATYLAHQSWIWLGVVVRRRQQWRRWSWRASQLFAGNTAYLALAAAVALQ